MASTDSWKEGDPDRRTGEATDTGDRHRAIDLEAALEANRAALDAQKNEIAEFDQTIRTYYAQQDE